MLRLAKRLLRQTLAELAPQISAGVPLVALEPSCGAGQGGYNEDHEFYGYRDEI
jgi:hypothetical protein